MTQRLGEVFDQTGLAHTGLAAEQHHATPSVERLLVAAGQHGHLGFTLKQPGHRNLRPPLHGRNTRPARNGPIGILPSRIGTVT
jgi:hypothetical protein